MKQEYSLSLVFPAYNEEDNLERLVGDADRGGKEVAKDYEIVIVDDGSTDSTPQMLERLKQSVPNLVVITHAPNKGYTAALRPGFTNAKKDLVV